MSKDFVNQYAKALFEVASDSKIKSSYLDQLRVIEKTIATDESASSFFRSVDVPLDKKLNIIDKALSTGKISNDVISTVKLLIERNKFGYLSKILHAYQFLNDEANGVVRGTVKSSHDLDENQRKAMSQKIESVLKKKVILDYLKDPKVIGGVKAQVGSYTFDDTFETHLKKMKDQINRRTH